MFSYLQGCAAGVKATPKTGLPWPTGHRHRSGSPCLNDWPHHPHLLHQLLLTLLGGGRVEHVWPQLGGGLGAPADARSAPNSESRPGSRVHCCMCHAQPHLEGAEGRLAHRVARDAVEIERPDRLAATAGRRRHHSVCCRGAPVARPGYRSVARRNSQRRLQAGRGAHRAQARHTASAHERQRLRSPNQYSGCSLTQEQQTERPLPACRQLRKCRSRWAAGLPYAV